MKQVFLDGNSLTLEQLEDIALQKATVSLTETAKEKVNKARAFVEKIVEEDRVVYGITTGFGKFSDVKISPENLKALQENLILSHATGVGSPFSEAETRAIMVLRANVLAKGHSGIRLKTLETLLAMLNKGVHPIIPQQGSVGASGDLAPLSHLVLVMLGYGEAIFQGEKMNGKDAMAKANIPLASLEAKEGLALNNGTQVMTGVGALALAKAFRLCKLADIVGALSLEALLGTPKAFDAKVHNVRMHKGQIASAQNLRNLIADSTIRQSHLHCEKVQDAYSLRCMPQVHGATRQALELAKTVLETEFNSATDNPLIFPDEEEVISGGNFHGQPIANVLDYVGIAVAELASISERRIERMVNPDLSGLPAFLATNGGLNSGYMIAHLTAASLTSENKVLAHPACVDSIPTSANKEDHVSMGTIGARQARDIVENVTHVLGIEYLIACQALDMHEDAHPSSPALEKARRLLRNQIPFMDKDRILYPDINLATRILSTELLPTVEGELGELA